MTCQQTQDLLHAYIDGELDLMTNVEIERHFDDCHNCSQSRQKQLELRSLIRNGAPYFAAPDLLVKRVQKAVRAPDKAEAKSPLMPRTWLAIAASVALIALSGLLTWTIISSRTRAQSNELLAQEIVSGHVRSLQAGHLTDVPSSEQHTVKPWFNGRLDFAPEVKDLSAQGFTLIGGRLDYINNRTVAALIYERRKHYINLFIWPSDKAADQPEQESTRQGYNVIRWNKSGMTYWAISDLNSAELHEFTRLIRD
jgi:anti-sigma factor RsiW